MKFAVIALFLLPVFAFAESVTVKQIKVSTYLRNLGPGNIKCEQGVVPNGRNYPTNSLLIINAATLSIPNQYAVNDYYAWSTDLGYPCEKFIQDFLDQRNEFGTIPVDVIISYNKSLKPEVSSFALVNERGENEGAKYLSSDVYSRNVEFKVGKITFFQTQSLYMANKLL